MKHYIVTYSQNFNRNRILNMEIFKKLELLIYPLFDEEYSKNLKKSWHHCDRDLKLIENCQGFQ